MKQPAQLIGIASAARPAATLTGFLSLSVFPFSHPLRWLFFASVSCFRVLPQRFAYAGNDNGQPEGQPLLNK